MVYGRFFNLEIGGEELLCGVPYADLFGHSGQSPTTWYYHEKRNGFELKATEEIKKGEKVHLNFGPKLTNMDSFLIHGFVPEPNEVFETQF